MLVTVAEQRDDDTIAQPTLHPDIVLAGNCPRRCIGMRLSRSLAESVVPKRLKQKVVVKLGTSTCQRKKRIDRHEKHLNAAKF